jgi:maltose alpha-D-glucosyltransferase/alpha-amylase
MPAAGRTVLRGPRQGTGRAPLAERAPEAPALPAHLLREQQRNTSVVYGDRYVLKVFRRIEDGVNPEVEVGRFLAEKTTFRHTPRLAGALEYRRGWGEPMTLAVLHEFVPHQGDGWRYCQDALGWFFEQALARQSRGADLSAGLRSPVDLIDEPPPPVVQETVGPALEAARQLGQHTGEMHLALASRPDDPAFAPEPFTALYQRSLYQSLRSQTRRAFVLLRKHLNELSEEVRASARELETQEDALIQSVRAVYQHKITAQRIRCHGDYNLREVLYTGRDFVVIDFEGMPSRPLSDRRRKYTPLRDVASMLRSFQYAALFALNNGGLRREDRPILAPWTRLWHVWVSVAFLKAYREVAARGTFLPANRDEHDLLLHFYLAKRALNELRYELGRSPERAAIPIQGLLQDLEIHAARAGERK